MKEEEKWERHPSYGHVQFARVSIGGGLNRKHRLFGSRIDNHSTAIMLRIVEAERVHRLGEDWTHGTGKMVAEVELSAAQFAELLTTMSVGTGVPCTIRHRADVGPVGDPPETETEVERSRESFRERVTGVAATVRPFLDKIEALAAKLPIKARDEVRMQASLVIQEIEKNVPFYLEQFREATERVTTAAKAEIEAFATHAVTVAGLDALKVRALAISDEDAAVLKELADS